MLDFMPKTASIGEVIRSFRDRFHLSKAKAAKVLGVSVNTIRSFEEGHDVSTGLPFSPRESTIRQLATKMTEYGYSVTYEEMMVAAEKLSQEEVDLHQGKLTPPTDEELARGEFKIPGLSDLAASSKLRWEDLSDEERRQVWNVMEAAGKAVVEQLMAGKKQRKLR